MRLERLVDLPYSLLVLILLMGETAGQASPNAIPPISSSALLPNPPTATAAILSSATTNTNTPQSTNNSTQQTPTAATITTSFLTTYYPILIAALLLLLFMLGVTYKLRRRQKKIVADYMSSRRQQALAQDVDNMVYTWDPTMPATGAEPRRAGVNGSGTHGRWYNPSNYLRRNEMMEGLDEHGLAPPPYKPGQAEPNAITPVPEDIPMRDMGRMSKPPEYGEVIREVSGEDIVESNSRR